ncbi:hypothetical protein ZIOFF_049289 [Zingiber officinale]|uniref:Uncharacterized protein n=1 Tax=Zingiber officinale TaxID=94328 RepID=A0A8J5KXH0_ZINOF|nr:hypothetical protein ZIOFF_049289 [Zingiber officinale]
MKSITGSLLRKLYTSPQKCPFSYDKLRLDPSFMEVLLSHSFLFDIFISPLYSQCFVQRHARELGRLRKTEETNNPYDMEEMVMPLQEFINDPIAHEIIHNGATFQVAGLTNNSYLEESHDVRNCLRKHPEFGHYVLEVAKHRLDHMLYVGLTEEHKKSANMFAELVGAQVISQSEAWSSTEQETTNKTGIFSAEPSYSSFYSAAALNQDEGIAGYLNITELLSPHDEPGRENMTVGKLIEAYEKCNSNLWKFQTTRRKMSLKRISSVKFSKKVYDEIVGSHEIEYLRMGLKFHRAKHARKLYFQARRSVPASILDQIQYLNSLDVELYKHAQDIFRRQEKHVMQNDDKGNLKAQEELQTSGCGSLFSCLPWKILSIIAFLAVIVLAILVTKRRRAGKLKM